MNDETKIALVAGLVGVGVGYHLAKRTSVKTKKQKTPKRNWKKFQEIYGMSDADIAKMERLIEDDRHNDAIEYWNEYVEFRRTTSEA